MFKVDKMTKYSVCPTPYLKNSHTYLHHMILIFDAMCKMYDSTYRYFFHFFKVLIFWVVRGYRLVGRHWTAWQHLTIIYTFSMESHWLVPTTAMSLKVSALHSPNFLNVPTTFNFFCQNNNFLNKNIWCFKKKL